MNGLALSPEAQVRILLSEPSPRIMDNPKASTLNLFSPPEPRGVATILTSIYGMPQLLTGAQSHPRLKAYSLKTSLRVEASEGELTLKKYKSIDDSSPRLKLGAFSPNLIVSAAGVEA